MNLAAATFVIVVSAATIMAPLVIAATRRASWGAMVPLFLFALVWIGLTAQRLVAQLLGAPA